jgi:hypothetical protein
MQLFTTFQGAPKEALLVVEVMLDRVRQLIEKGEDHELVVGCERFTQLHRRTAITHKPIAQQVVGQVEGLGDRYGFTVSLQGPADAKAVAPNDVLKRTGLLVSKHDVDRPDANDVNMAVRHAILALSRKHATLFERLVL